MTLRKSEHWFRLQPATLDSRMVVDEPAASGHQPVDWRGIARELGRRLMPALVLAGAALLGMAAVAIS